MTNLTGISVNKNANSTITAPTKPNIPNSAIKEQVVSKPLTPPKAVVPVKPVTASGKNTSPAVIVSLEKLKAPEKPLYNQTGGLENNSSSNASNAKEPKIEPKGARVEPKVVTPKVVSKVEIKNTDSSTSRSGFGDGTNPGQGDGKTNAINQDTNKSSKANNYVVKPTVVSQFKFAI